MNIKIDNNHEDATPSCAMLLDRDTGRICGFLARDRHTLSYNVEVYGYAAKNFATKDECRAFIEGVEVVCNRLAHLDKETVR